MSGKFLENVPFNGFDDSGAVPWQMVRTGKKKHLWLRAPKNANIWFKPFDSPHALVSFTGKSRQAPTGTKELEVCIDGLAAGPPVTFNAVSDKFQVPIIVEVLDPQSFRVNLIQVRDKSGWTKRSQANFEPLVKNASKIFEYQANISVEFHQRGELDATEFDLGQKEQSSWVKKAIWKKLQKKVDDNPHWHSDVNVFCVPAWGALDDDGNCWLCQIKRRFGFKISNVIGTHYQGKIIIEDKMNAKVESVLAHEIGHWLGFRTNSSVHDEINKDALMYPETGSQKRLYRDHVASIRKKMT